MRLFPATTEWFRAHRPGAASLKIGGGLAGGVAFSGVIAASWIGSWSAMETPRQAQLARAVPQEIKAGAQRSSMIAPAQTSEAEQPTSAPAGAQTARQIPCDRQTWPYIEHRCLENDEAPSARPQQQDIRVISPDRRGPSQREARTRSTTGLADAGSDANAAAPQADSVPLPPEKPRRMESAPAIPHTAGGRPTATHEEALRENATAPADDNPSRENAARDNGARKNAAIDNAARDNTAMENASKDDARSATQRQADAKPAEDEAAEWRPRRRSQRSVETQEHGRHVTVLRSYVLPNGRRVIVRETYRTVQAPELSRPDAPRFRRPYAGSYRVVPRRFIFED